MGPAGPEQAAPAKPAAGPAAGLEHAAPVKPAEPAGPEEAAPVKPGLGLKHSQSSCAWQPWFAGLPFPALISKLCVQTLITSIVRLHMVASQVRRNVLNNFI